MNAHFFKICAMSSIAISLIILIKQINFLILQRLFNFYIGDITKSFCRIVRFQNLLKINQLLKNDLIIIYAN